MSPLLLCVLFNPGVSIHSPAIHMSELVAQLAQQTGLKLECAANIADETLVIEITDRPADEVMSEITKVTDTTWKTDGEVRRLVRSPEMLKAEKAKEDAKILSALTSLIAENLARVKALPPIDKDAIANELNDSQWNTEDRKALLTRLTHQASANPEARFLFQVLSEIGAKKLLSLRNGQTAVYSDQPTMAQFELPLRTKPVLTKLKMDVRRIIVENSKQKSDKPRVNMGELPQYASKLSDAGYGKMLLKVRKLGSLSFQVRLALIDQKGFPLTTFETYFPQRSVLYSRQVKHEGEVYKPSPQVQDYLSMGREIGVAEASSTSVEVEGKRYHAGSYLPFREQDGQGPLASIEKFASDPFQFEPVAFIVAPPLQSIAARQKKNLIASIDDSTLAAILNENRWGGFTTDQDYLDIPLGAAVPPDQRVPKLQVIPNETYLEVKPFLSYRARLATVNRRKLRDLISGIRTTGTLTMETAANFYSSSGVLPTFGSISMNLINHAIAGRSFDNLFTPALPILMKLNPQQWSSAIRGDLPLSQVNADTQNLITDLMNSSGIQLAGNGSFLNEWHIWDQPLRSELTELLPNGLSPTMPIKLEETTETKVIGKSLLGFHFLMSVGDMGLYEHDRRNQNHYASKREFGGFQPVSAKGYKLTLPINKSMFVTTDLNEDIPLGKVGFVSREQLPADFLKLAQKIDEALSKRN